MSNPVGPNSHLEDFEAWATEMVRAHEAAIVPKDTDFPEYRVRVRHRWRKGLLGGPIRCAVCKVRVDGPDANAECPGE